MSENIKKFEIVQGVINITEKLLNLQNLTENDDLFDVGADSLAALDLIYLIHQKYKIKLEVVELFKQRTFSSIANIIFNSLLEKPECLIKEAV